jgi:hypothetical protein
MNAPSDHITLTRQEAEQIEDALGRSIRQLVAHTSNEPYPDDPRWTPWTRFAKPVADRCSAARTMLRKKLA